jgi:hypothetical protein
MKRESWVIPFILVLLLTSVSCSTTDTVEPDTPTLSAEEVKANVQDRMRLQVYKTISCASLVERSPGWDKMTATYQGSGEWTVWGRDWLWSYFEATGAVSSHHRSSQNRAAC